MCTGSNFLNCFLHSPPPPHPPPAPHPPPLPSQLSPTHPQTQLHPLQRLESASFLLLHTIPHHYANVTLTILLSCLLYTFLCHPIPLAPMSLFHLSEGQRSSTLITLDLLALYNFTYTALPYVACIVVRAPGHNHTGCSSKIDVIPHTQHSTVSGLDKASK